MNSASLPVAIIGAGPVGLAAAAHLLARGATPLVLEAGSAVASNIRQWEHVQMFTPWRFCVDRAAAALLGARGWKHPPRDAVPTGGALVAEYLEPLGKALAPFIELNARVVAVTRKGADKVRSAGREGLPFVLRVEGPAGDPRRIEARAVIDASGTWNAPNPMGADGLPAIGEAEAADRIATGIPDVLGACGARYAGKTTAVIGSGHSALNSLIELAALRKDAPGTKIVWLMRKQRIEAAFGGETADALPARGALGSQARDLVETGAVEVMTPFRVAVITRDAHRIRIQGAHAGVPASVITDEIIVATGFRPDLSMLREIRLTLDPWLESAGIIGPLIDPNLHSCGRVRPHGAGELAHAEPDFFIAGMKNYGRAPTFLLATGHEQVRSIAAALTGDAKAAARVELELPETGVCNERPPSWDVAATASVCCTPVTPQGVCCPPNAELPADAVCRGSSAPAVEVAATASCRAPRSRELA
jgi:thioredoxin reductase